MNKNLIRILLIILVIVLAGLIVCPPSQKLKAGIDLGGGTSLIYDFNTQGMSKEDTEGLALRNIPVLRRRIDPQNLANLVIRPLGDTRIEIQMPASSQETKEKRVKYEEALKDLDNQNLNLIVVKNALRLDTEARQLKFDEFAGQSDTRIQILNELAVAYDALTQAQTKCDALKTQMTEIKNKINATTLSADSLEIRAPQWAELTDTRLSESIDIFTKSQPSAKPFVEAYMKAYKQYAPILNNMADPEKGVRQNFKVALTKLADLNLNTLQIKDILQLPEKSKKRAEMVKTIENGFPDRKEKIKAVLATYAEYAPSAGRLDDPEDLKRMLKGSGKLEFRILPTFSDTKSNRAELEGLIAALPEKGPKLATSKNYVWAEIETPELALRWQQQLGYIVGTFGDKYYVLASNKSQEALLHGGEKPWKLKSAYQTTDGETGRNVIGFSFDAVGTSLFYLLTGDNINRPLAIMLDEIAINAPNIKSAINGSGIITGEYTKLELTDMINKLNAGSFQASLSEAPVSEKTIGSTLGKENRDKGITAGIYGMIAVAVFMVIYYLQAGSIADVALFMNLLFILATMVTLRATFTLPGIAGLILTIGMSVDANVLIFERIREEQQRGSSLRAAIANGYKKAKITIFDANITTFIVAMILYLVASEEIKGFAIVLMIGIVFSMITAIFVTRVIFNILLDTGLIKNKLVMLKIVGKPNVNWMGIRKAFFTVSAVLVIGGLSVFFLRDEDENSKFDIEFTGGTNVVVDFRPVINYTAQDVERIIHKVGTDMGNALETAKVYSTGDTGKQFEISTTETNKTTATVTFKTPGTQTVESVTDSIKNSMRDIANLYNLKVKLKGTSFEVSTSLVNKAIVDKVLTAAFEDTATVSDIKVDEVVSKAVRDAFAGMLNAREDLEGTVTAVEKITDDMTDIADYLGGIKITCQLKNETTAKDLIGRFETIRLKSDMQSIIWYQEKILASDLTDLEPDQKVKSFVYVGAHPEAAYRPLSETEWSQFSANEKVKVASAVAIKESLSRVTQIDPSIGKQAKQRAIIAIILSLIVIVAYIWIRFGTARYGLAAIAALVHDVSITLGAVTVCYFVAGTSFGRMLGIRDFKINLEMIAAFLTIIGYSLNDTIVVFDRIRENRGKQGKLNANIISNSINQTLARTLLTSFTTFLVVLIMYVFGGTGLRGFTFAMLVGIIVGTYSSIAIAAPILLWGSSEPDDTTKS